MVAFESTVEGLNVRKPTVAIVKVTGRPAAVPSGTAAISKTLAPVIEKHYDLIKWMIPKINQFPRDQRFLLADRIEKLLLDVLELLVAAMYSSRRKEYLHKVNYKLDVLRLLMRLSKDLGYVNVKAYDFVAKQFLEIGRMVGGWMKQSE
ncbi:MAG: diversity-generating retroelement protein Avd [Candidatus Omnitrophota bacterium]